MPIYRFYLLGKSGKCYRFTDWDCVDDECAIAHAQNLPNEYGVEVFVREGRRVGRVDPIREDRSR